MGPTNRHFITALIIFLALSVASCGNGGGGGGSSTPPYIYAEIDSLPPGSALTGFQSASVYVIDDDTGYSITNAAVEINGMTLPYNATDEGYEGNVVVSLGDNVTLSVTVGGNTYTVSGFQFKSYPSISAPLSNALWGVSFAHTVTWTGGNPMTNAVYGLGVLDAADPNGQLIWPGDGSLKTVPIGTTSNLIPANKLTVGNRIVIVGIWTGISIPNAAPGSDFVFGGFNYVPITIANITNETLTAITVTPTDQSIAKGTTQQFSATGTFADNSTRDLTNLVAWTSSDTTKVTISNAGLATGKEVGSATITATSGGISGSTSLRVVAAFAPGVKYPNFSTSVWLGNTAVGDLNGDGCNDVAVMEWLGTRVLIYYQNAGGTLDPPLVITTGISLRGIAIGDVNNDGLADLIVSGNSAIAVFRQNQSTHTLGDQQNYTLSTYNSGAVAIADLNGDGLLDVVAAGVGSGGNGVLSFMFQGQGGVLGPEVTYTSVPVEVDGELHVADMNNDGRNDIVLQSGPLQLAVIKQVSPGVFSSPGFYTVQTNYWPKFQSFVLADLNGDGRTDVIVADLTDYLNIFYQNANGILTGPTILNTYGESEVDVADLDGDGLNDIILLSSGNTVEIRYQSTNHSFQNSLFYILPTQSYGGTFIHEALSVGDVTGDGLPDIVASWSNDGIFVLPRLP